MPGPHSSTDPHVQQQSRHGKIKLEPITKPEIGFCDEHIESMIDSADQIHVCATCSIVSVCHSTEHFSV